MFKTLRQIWVTKDLRNKILFTLFAVLVYRLMTHITIPGVNREALQAVFAQNELLGAFSLLTGGSAENFSIVLMGLSPYINASIIMQLLTVIFPRLEEMSKEGESGRKTLNRWARYITLPLALVQSYGMVQLLNAQSQIPIIADMQSFSVLFPVLLTVTAGTVALMWIGEVITEKGIGNGISILIFSGILASIPPIIGPTLALAQTEPERLLPFAGVLLIMLILTMVVVLFTEGQRRVPITYAGRKSDALGQQSFLPIRVNQAGMIPIIFAASLVTFPSILGQFLVYADSPWVQSVGRFLTTQFTPQSWLYIILYFLFGIGFTYFYVSITFNTDQVAENIQKRGGFVTGIRPGRETSEHLAYISNRMNLFGGVMIGGIAIFPLVLQKITAILGASSIPLVVGGAGIIIVVGVVVDLIRRVNASLLMHHYERFYKG